MLRSFKYAAHTAVAQDSAQRFEDLARLEPLVHDWESKVGRVFLAAYDEAVDRSGLVVTDFTTDQIGYPFSYAAS